MTAERWRTVAYAPMYEVSDLGRVRSLHVWRGTRRVKAQRRHPSGYMVVDLTTAPGKANTCRVHRLVMEAFIGIRPKGLVSRHLNGDQADNRLANLAYGTYSENNRDQVLHGTHQLARRTHCDSGHEFTPANTRIRKGGGGRLCRTCERAHQRQWEAANRQRRSA